MKAESKKQKAQKAKKKRKMRKESKSILIFLAALFLAVSAIYFVVAGAFTASVTPTSVNQSTTYLYNFTIANDAADVNITEVKITLPSGFSFVSGSYGSSVASTSFSNTSSILTWSKTSLIENGSTEYFWFNATASTPGSYNFVVTINDTANITNTTDVAISVNDVLPPIINLVSPESSTITSQAAQTFTCNITDAGGISNLTLYVWNSTASIYTNTSQLSGTSNSTSWNYTLPYQDTFKWNCLGYDNYSDYNWSSEGNRTIALDTTPPEIDLISPEDDYSTTSTSVTFKYNVSDTNDIENCSLFIDNKLNKTDTSITKDTEQSFTITLSVDSYKWKIGCYDEAGNQENSSSRDLEIESEEEEGGASEEEETWEETYAVEEEDFEEGYTKLLKEDERLEIEIDNEKHYVGVIDLTSTAVKIEVKSSPQQAVLNIGDEKKFEVTDDTYYDLYVKLNNISNNKANLTIKSIHEKIPTITTTTANETSLCGNGKIDSGENCENCAADVKCAADEECKAGTCVKKTTSKTKLMFWISAGALIAAVLFFWAKTLIKRKKNYGFA